MVKRAFAAFIVLLMVFLIGCTQEQTSTTGKAFIGGTKGLSAEFLTGSPPDSVYTDTPFSISVRLENIGEYDINRLEDATVEITGIDPSDFGLTTTKKEVSDQLYGAKLDVSGKEIKGASTVVEFDGLQYNKQVSGTVSFPILANICYEYGAKSQSKLCILKDLTGRTTEARICDPDNQNVDSESGGAPVQVIGVSQNVMGQNKISFTLTIKNTGTGLLYQQNTQCLSTIPTKDRVWVEVVDPNLGQLTCSGLKEGTATSGYVTLFGNQIDVRCTQMIDNPSDQIKVLEVNLRYGYKESIQKSIDVKQSS